MSQRARQFNVILAYVLLAGSIIGWPLSAFWLARDEPQYILGLSWFAVLIQAITLLIASMVHKEQGEAAQETPAD